MGIYETGDTHGNFSRFSKSNGFPAGSGDLVIVSGDCGVLWDNSKEQKYWIKWLSERNFTLAFVCGNHENYDMLEKFPTQSWMGGKIRRISHNIIYLMRGQVYLVSGFSARSVTLFTFGGAKSTDKEPDKRKIYGVPHWKGRKEGKDWWRQEMPSKNEYDEGLKNLNKVGNKVNYVITHTVPSTVLTQLSTKVDSDDRKFVPDELTDYLSNLKIEYDKWYAGHFHVNTKLDKNINILYSKIELIEL